MNRPISVDCPTCGKHINIEPSKIIVVSIIHNSYSIGITCPACSASLIMTISNIEEESK